MITKHGVWRRLLLLPDVRQIFQSDDEVAWSAQNRKALREKGMLRRLYISYYEQHLAHLSRVPGRTLEVGSGGGFFREVCPQAFTSDVLKVGQVELVLDAERLPFADGSLSNIVFMGVLHHLQDPFRFFEEAQRALAPGGRIVFTEPHISYFSYFIYKYLHHEPCEFSGVVEEGGALRCGNQAVASVLFGRRRAEFERRFPGLRLRAVRYHDIFLYLLSGGVNYRSFAPGFLFSPLRLVERVLSPFARYLAMFMTVVIEKQGDGRRQT